MTKQLLLLVPLMRGFAYPLKLKTGTQIAGLSGEILEGEYSSFLHHYKYRLATAVIHDSPSTLLQDAVREDCPAGKLAGA